MSDDNERARRLIVECVVSQQANKIVAPWGKRGFELEEKHGTYSHYVAWEEWFEQWNEQQPETMQVDIDIVSTLVLYSAFTAALCQSVVESGKSHVQDNERAKRLIAECDEFDSFWFDDNKKRIVFLPDLGTEFTATELRIIADELDRRNGVGERKGGE